VVITLIVLFALGLYGANNHFKQKAFDKAYEENSLLNEGNMPEDTNPVEHRHHMHADFGDQAEGLQISHETPIQVEDEDIFPQPQLSLTYNDEEATAADPTFSAEAPPPAAAGGIGGFFRGFFCQACEATENQPEMQLTTGTDPGVEVRR